MKLRGFLFFLTLTVSLQGAYAQTFTVGDFMFIIDSYDGSISVYALYDAISGDITIPSSVEYGETTHEVTAIGVDAFEGCRNLTSVIIPNSVTNIRADAFRNCNRLTSVTIPNSVTKIKRITFASCRSLASVTIPNSVATIEGLAFANCTSLASVTIPNSVTKIEGFAFVNCHGLKDVTVSWNMPLSLWEDNSPFNEITLSRVTLHVPDGTENFYGVAPVWKEFRVATSVGNERVEPIATLNAWTTDGIVHIAGLRTGEAFVIYNMQGQLIYKGIARTDEEEVPLGSTSGVYILAASKRQIKFYL
ncbi:MAG: leucine-rich repeat domain-containing protein [Tannerellaceae bacterium]|jgi:hypothetical protein|nr:leucine-rich repeat domain-containing protein [Tannerellaceae bacterium]